MLAYGFLGLGTIFGQKSLGTWQGEIVSWRKTSMDWWGVAGVACGGKEVAGVACGGKNVFAKAL